MDINDANASESVSRLDLEIYEVYDDYHARLIRPERTYARRRWVTLVVGYLDSFLETTYRLELHSWLLDLEHRRCFCVAVPVNPTELKCKLWELICIGLCLPKFGHWRRPNVFSRKIVHGIRLAGSQTPPHPKKYFKMQFRPVATCGQTSKS